MPLGTPDDPIIEFLTEPGALTEPYAGAGVPYSLELRTMGVRRVGYVVMDANYVWRSGGEYRDLGNTNDQITYATVMLRADGDRVKGFDAETYRQADNSPVVLTTLPADPNAPILQIYPDPGTLYVPVAGSPVQFTFTARSIGVSAIHVSVFNPNGSWTDGGTTYEFNNIDDRETLVTITFTASGQRIKLMNNANWYDNVDSGEVNIQVQAPTTDTPDPVSLLIVNNWFQGLGLSHNVERSWWWNIPGGIIPAADYYYNVCGFRDLRGFYAWRPAYNMLGEGQARPTKAQFARFLDACELWVACGFKIRAYIMDVLILYLDMDTTARVNEINDHVRDCLIWIKERGDRLPKDKVIWGLANELGDDQNYVPHQVNWHNMFRAALPGYILACGANYWQAWNYLTRSRAWTTDKLTVWPVHIYEDHDPAGWLDIRDQLRAWSQANGGVKVIVDEFGGGYQNVASMPETWVDNVTDAFPALDEFYVSFWSSTNGNEWKWNEGQTYNLISYLETLIIRLTTRLNGVVVTPPPPPLPEITLQPYYEVDGSIHVGNMTAATEANVAILLEHIQHLEARLKAAGIA